MAGLTACLVSIIIFKKVIDMQESELRNMKAQMAKRGNWKEVRRLNKCLELHNFKTAIGGAAR